MALEEYRRKRDFKKTPEPAGKPGAVKVKDRSFVIQKHAASRLHYDFRLELDGVLKSWAVPKGPSLDPGEKRLAVHVEDHPIEYGDFEGIIPRGEYGGGTVLLWEQGTWEPIDLDADKGYAKGHLKLRLAGEKLRGGWNLVRMGGRRNEGADNWLLIKEDDDEARPGTGDAILVERPESVASGKSLEEIAADPPRVWRSNRAEESPAAEPAGFKEKLRRVARAAAERALPPAAKKAGAGGKAAPAKKAERTEKAKAAPAKKTKAAATASPRRASGAKKPPKESARSSNAAEVPGAVRGALPKGGIEPQLATLVDRPPTGDAWLHEIKYDGYRALLECDGGDVHLYTRRGNDWTAKMRPIADAAAPLAAHRALVDGEVVVLQPDGTTSFQALQEALGDGEGELTYLAFDLLHLDGYDLRRSPLAARKAALAALLAELPEGSAIRYATHVEGRGEDFFQQACRFHLEGIIAKRADLPYRSGRGRDWVKVKCLQRQELVVVGYTDPEGSRSGFGALLLAVHDDAGELVFAGRVGTGFDQAALADIHRRLLKLRVKTPAFKNAPRGAEARRSHWVEPRLVAEVAFGEWTDEGLLRHPSFQGLREDKDPAEIVREKPVPPPSAAASAEAGEPKKKSKPKSKSGQPAPPPAAAKPPAAAAKPPAAPAAAGAPPVRSGKPGKPEEIAGVRITHPDRVLYPGAGITKGDVARFYQRIAAWALPQLADRPLTLVRCPDGQGGECFYQKHVSGPFPATIARIDVGEEQPYGALRDLAGLLALVQMSALEIHIWGSHVDRLEQPDYIVFDLDPDEGLDWQRVVAGARAVKARLEELGLAAFLKTTGGKGLHVVSPLARRLEWDEVKTFTKAVADSIVAAEPRLYTGNLLKVRRQGKIFIDYLRNGRGATSIAPYSTRARPGAPVSTPLFWEELDDAELRGNTFTVENLPARLEALRADPWDGFAKAAKPITAAMQKAAGAKP